MALPSDLMYAFHSRSLKRSAFRSRRHLKVLKHNKRSRNVTYFNEEGSQEIVSRTEQSKIGAELHSFESPDTQTYVTNNVRKLTSPNDMLASPNPFGRHSLSPNMFNQTRSDVEFGFNQTQPIQLSRDPFKTGKKHRYNMLRPTIYEKKFDSFRKKNKE